MNTGGKGRKRSRSHMKPASSWPRPAKHRPNKPDRPSRTPGRSAGSGGQQLDLWPARPDCGDGLSDRGLAVVRADGSVRAADAPGCAAAWPLAVAAAHQPGLRPVRRRAAGYLARHSAARCWGRAGWARPASPGPGMAVGAGQETGDGSLPSGRDIGREYGRHERWGRMVKRSGLAGELDPQTWPSLIHASSEVPAASPA
jgi:hypothetical protein